MILEDLVLKQIQEKFSQQVLGTEEISGLPVAVVSPSALPSIAAFLKDTPGLDFNLLMDLAGADYLNFPQAKPGRFCVCYQFYSVAHNRRIFLKIYLPEENPMAPSLHKLYAGANWLEREVWDMYGVRFEGHPHLKRILMYEEFQGHALRKDYAIGKMQPLIPMREAIDYEKVRLEMRQQAGK
jgi:NADH/F420H2 dehydrogenase subunit C